MSIDNSFHSVAEGLTVFSGVIVIIAVIFALFVIAACVLQIIGLYKVFKKAGKGGWEAIIPYYNNWVLVEISGCHWWYFLLMISTILVSFNNASIDNGAGFSIGIIAPLLSLASIYASLCANYNIAKKFNKSTGFAVGMTFLPFVFYMILGCSDKCTYDSSVQVSPWGIYDFDKNKKQKKYCGNCGSEMSGNFCPNCGTKGE